LVGSRPLGVLHALGGNFADMLITIVWSVSTRASIIIAVVLLDLLIPGRVFWGAGLVLPMGFGWWGV
jgi:hypothetical protein